MAQPWKSQVSKHEFTLLKGICTSNCFPFPGAAYREYTSQYLVHVWIVTILSMATFIKFYYLYKAALLMLMFAVYSILIVLLMNWKSGM